MKRGNIFFWFAAAVALMAIAGCAKTVHTPENGRHSIGFNVQEPVKSAVTGAADIASFEVWGWYGSNTEERNKNVFNGTQVKKTGSVWTYDNLQYWVPDMNYIFYAVYPFGVVECSADGTVTVEKFDCSATGSDAVDLMTAGAVEGSGNSPQSVVFKFSHELAKVKFTVKTADPDGVAVSLLKLYGISAKGSLTKPQKGSALWNLENAVGSDDTPYFVKEEVVLNAGNSYTAEPFGELLLPPHAALAEARLSFSYYYGSNSTQIKSADIPLAAGTGGITSWEAGKSYNYTVEIQANRDIKINVTVTDWDERDTSVTWTPNN